MKEALDNDEKTLWFWFKKQGVSDLSAGIALLMWCKLREQNPRRASQILQKYTTLSHNGNGEQT